MPFSSFRERKCGPTLGVFVDQNHFTRSELNIRTIRRISTYESSPGRAKISKLSFYTPNTTTDKHEPN